MKKLLNLLFPKQTKCFAIILDDGHKYYIKSEYFKTKDDACLWMKDFNKSTLSVKAVEVIDIRAKTRLIDR